MPALAQLRPGDTDPHQLYSPAGGQITDVSFVTVANRSGSGVVFELHVDRGGQAFGDDTLVAKGTVAANDSEELLTKGFDLSDGQRLGVVSGSADDLNFTAFGRQRGGPR